jgi:UDP-N-acetylglucosamine/UDP-N-acetylgalactosamine diphosphorylase
MHKKEFVALMEEYGQEHIINHLKTLSAEDEEDFLSNASGMNIELVFSLYERFSSQNDKPVKYEKVEPPEVIDSETANSKGKNAVIQVGEKTISDGQTAVTIVAGGQGTRLGYPHPKGMYPVSPLRGKSLFQINSEKVLTLSQRYKAKIPLLVLTNSENRKEIEDFFRKNRFFGLEKESLFFFTQEMLPSITPDKKLILRDRTSLLSNPDGHGGSLKALWESGLIKKLEELGVTKIFYCHIDNPLVRIDDPLFLGWHIKEEADFSLKVVRKRNPEEKVGNLVFADGKHRIIEYIELPDELKDMKDSRGNPVFWAGSIGIHFMNTDFIKKLNENGFALPYHKQVKEAPRGIHPEAGEIWKFETFVFDALPLAKKVCCMETMRDEEFAPLKNSEGEDSPEEVKKVMVNLYKKQISELGIDGIPPEIKIEVSPAAGQDKKTLLDRIKKSKILFNKDVYID